MWTSELHATEGRILPTSAPASWYVCMTSHIILSSPAAAPAGVQQRRPAQTDAQTSPVLLC